MDASDIAALRSNQSISGTIAFIDALNEIGDIIAKDKRRVYKQMLVIAKIYPQGQWDKNHEQWSINQYYNNQTEKMDEVFCSPAETLNLVCRALLDKKRYLSEEGCEDKDLKSRLIVPFRDLLELRLHRKAGNLEKCSAGLQHDLLYWLNVAFLDKPKGEKDAKAVQLLMGIPEFFKESVSMFLHEQLQAGYKESEAATNAMLEAWEQFSGDDKNQDPLILWLRARFAGESESIEGNKLSLDNGWKQACGAFIEKRCREFGINPNSYDYLPYIDAIYSLPLPDFEDKLLLKIHALKQLPEIPITHNQFSPQDYSSKHLMHLRNRALEFFKGSSLDSLKKRSPQKIEELFSLLIITDELLSCSDIVFLMDHRQEELVRAREKLKLFLIDYWQDYDWSKPLPEEYWQLKSLFSEKKQALFSDETANINFISNYFAIQNGVYTDWRKFWKQLQALRGPNQKGLHALIFTDETLTIWQQQAQSLSEAGVTIDLTPYAINRLLLHGLLLPYQQWSPLYSNYLKIVCEWLLTANPKQKLLHNLIRAYSKDMLKNLYLLSCLHSMLDKKQRAVITEKNRLNYYDSLEFFAVNFLAEILGLPENTLSLEKKSEILEALQRKFGMLITNVHDLKFLMGLSEDQLNTQQKTRILTAIEDRLGEIIERGNGLILLMDLSENQLNTQQKTRILTAVEDRLGKIIKNGMGFRDLMKLPKNKLNIQQKAQIFTSVEDRLGEFVESGFELIDLMNFSEDQLNTQQKTQILRAVEGRLGELFTDSKELKKLMNLPEHRLNSEQKLLIWRSVSPKLKAELPLIVFTVDKSVPGGWRIASNLVQEGLFSASNQIGKNLEKEIVQGEC